MNTSSNNNNLDLNLNDINSGNTNDRTNSGNTNDSFSSSANNSNNSSNNENINNNNNINDNINANNIPPKLLPGGEGIENPTLTGNTERELAGNLINSFETLKENGTINVRDVKEQRILATESQQILDHNERVRETGRGDYIQVQGHHVHNTLAAVFEDSEGALRYEVKSSATPPNIASRDDYYYDEMTHLWGQSERSPSPSVESSASPDSGLGSSPDSVDNNQNIQNTTQNTNNVQSTINTNPNTQDEDSDLYGSPVNHPNLHESESEDSDSNETGENKSSKRKRDSDEENLPVSKKVNKDDDDEPKGSGLSGSGTGSGTGPIGGSEGQSGGIFRVYLDSFIISLSTISNAIVEAIDTINNMPY